MNCTQAASESDRLLFIVVKTFWDALGHPRTSKNQPTNFLVYTQIVPPGKTFRFPDN